MSSTTAGTSIINFLELNSPFVRKSHGTEGQTASTRAPRAPRVAWADLEDSWRANVAVADPGLISELNKLLNQKLQAIDTFDVNDFSRHFKIWKEDASYTPDSIYRKADGELLPMCVHEKSTLSRT